MEEYEEKEKLNPSEIVPVLYNEEDFRRESGQVRVGREIERRKKANWFLYFSAITANLTIIACGCTLTWSASAIPKLKSTNPEVNPLGFAITPLQVSLVASLPSLGATVGPVFSGRCADVYGRRKTLIVVIVIKTISFIVLAFASNIILFYITRFVLGICVGILFCLLPMYIGEVSENHNRGKLGCLIPLFGATGNLYTLVMGPVLSLKYFTLLCAAPLIYVLVCFIFFIPESPMHLANIGQREQAVRSLMKYRSTDRNSVQSELVEIISSIEETKNISISNFFKSQVLRKALLICIVLGILNHLSGIDSVVGFTQSIFDLTGSDIPSSLCMILIGVVQMIAVVIASSVVEKLGRRILLFISCIACCIGLVSLGTYFYLKDSNFTYITNISWLPVTSLVIYCVSFNFGLSPVPFIIVSEMFSPKMRSVGSSVTMFFMFLASFCELLAFPFMVLHLGTATCFFIFGVCCILGIVFVYFVVPETKGKSLIEIQQILNFSYT